MDENFDENYDEMSVYSLDELLLEKDQVIDDLNTRVKTITALNQILTEKIIDLQNIINSNLPPYLNKVLEFL
jgi:chaperonin cofactor prefoldin